MTAEDYEDVYSLWACTPGMGLNPIDDSEAGIRRYLARNPSTCFVARDDDSKVVGCVLSGHDGRRGFIYHLSVDQESRNRGIGRALVDSAITALQNEGIIKVALVVYESNELGNGFWERIGFEKRPDLVYRNKVIHPGEVD
jgi:ribosomal protein S18 acetylase RimI-like enzyme